MSSGRVLGFFVAAAVLSLSAVGCASTTDDEASATGAQEAVAAGVKVLAKDRRYPSNLLFADGKLYWSEATQVASGDPELDQEFAYWTGTLYSFNVSHSQNPKKLSDLPSPVRGLAMVGNDVYIAQSGFVSKTTLDKLDTSEGWGEVYGDVDHFEVNENDEISGAVAANGRVYVLRTTGDIVSVKADGSDFKKHVKSTSYASNFAVVGDKAFWTTATDQPYERAIFTASLSSSSATPSQVVVVRDDPSNFLADGGSVYFGVQAKPNEAGSGAIMKLGGAGAPQPVVSGMDRVNSLVLDGDALLFTGKRGSEEGLFRIAKSELGTGTPKKILTLKVATDILPTADTIFVSSGALDAANHYAGQVVALDRASIH